MTKLISFFIGIIMFLFPCLNIPKADVDPKNDKTNYTYVFVHGLGGWGEYSPIYDLAPYWGVLSGDMMKYLKARGYDCKAASVSPTYSAWDRACELYAQLTGTVTDYGKEHSERCNHERYGTDYTGKALISSWNEEDKINLLGHSFGGATILLMLDLLKDGSEAEKAVTDKNELSELFTGGKETWVNSITALSAPMNGTTAYYIKDEIKSDPKATAEERLAVTAIGALTDNIPDNRITTDYSGYDLSVDGAMEILENIETIDSVYYFSIPCAVTTKDENGNWTYNPAEIEPIYRGACGRIMKWTGVSPKGYVLDESWQENDSLVNTISAKAPFGAPQKDFDKNDVQKGIWNIFPTHHGDHMSLMGELLKTDYSVREIYLELLDTINNAG